jgi:hypothetical protein
MSAVPAAPATTSVAKFMLYGNPQCYWMNRDCAHCKRFTRSTIHWLGDQYMFVCDPYYRKECVETLNARVGLPGEVYSFLLCDKAPRTPPSSDDEDDEDDAAATVPAVSSAASASSGDSVIIPDTPPHLRVASTAAAPASRS